MSEIKLTAWLRVLLFMFAMYLLALSAPFVDILIFVFMFIITWAFVKWEGGESIVELGLELDNRVSRNISIGAISAALAAAIVTAIAFFFGGQLRPVNEITGDLIVNLVLNAALFSFFEELTHRGYILTRVESLAGRKIAIVFSSLFFSLLHFSWWGPAGFNTLLIVLFTFNIFLGGVVLSFSYFWSGKSLWTPISFHFMWNVLAYTAFPDFPQVSVIQPEIFQIEWGITTVIGFLFALAILWSFLALAKKKM
ncbi:MAG: lysostaphin resistance A-like protein [Candidatus Thorarchaeota archaeon]